MRGPSYFWIGDYFAKSGDRATARFYLRRAAEDLTQAHLAAGIDPRPAVAFHLLRRWPRTLVRRALQRLGLLRR